MLLNVLFISDSTRKFTFFGGGLKPMDFPPLSFLPFLSPFFFLPSFFPSFLLFSPFPVSLKVGP